MNYPQSLNLWVTDLGLKSISWPLIWKWVSRFLNHCIWERWSCRCESHSFWRKRGTQTSKQKQVSYDSLVTLRRTFTAEGSPLLQLLSGRHTGTHMSWLHDCLALPETPRLWGDAANRALSPHICCTMHNSWEHVSELPFCFHPWNRLHVQPGQLPTASYVLHRESLSFCGEEKEVLLSRMLFCARDLRTQAQNTK